MIPIPSYIDTDGISIHYVSGKNQVWPPHCHAEYQIIISPDPQSECEISWRSNSGRNQTAAISGQNIIYIERGTPHSFCIGKKGVFISLGIPAEEVERLTMGNIWENVKIVPWWRVLRYDVFIWNIIQVIREFCYQKHQPHPKELGSHAQVLASHLLAIERDRKASICDGLTPLQLRKVMIHIGDHFQGKLTVDKLAELVGLKRDHFAHLFKTTTGISPHRCITALRINYAQRLKSIGKMTASEIAIDAGFCDQSHFVNCVKKFCRSDAENYRGILPNTAESFNTGTE